MRVTVAAVVALLLAGCGPSASDARTFQKVLDAGNMVPSEMKLKILIQGCSEIGSCAGSCERALGTLAQVSVDQRGAILGHGCADFRKFAEGRPRDDRLVDDFERDWLRRYAARAREKLDGDERARFDASWDKLGLGGVR